MAIEYFNPAAVATVAKPDEQRLKQQQQVAEQLMPAVYALLSGQQVQGMTPRLAQQLMEVFTPNVVANIYARAPEGVKIDPNWYQNYIKPGTVSPNVYATIMDYSNKLSQQLANIDPQASIQALRPWQENIYQMGGNIPTWRQTMLTNVFDTARMAQHGYELDPFTGEWRLDPNVQLNLLAGLLSGNLTAEEGYGLDVNDSGDLSVNNKGLFANAIEFGKKLLQSYIDSGISPWLSVAALPRKASEKEQQTYTQAIKDAIDDSGLTKEELETLLQILQQILQIQS